ELVFSGGEGRLLTTGVTESELAHAARRGRVRGHRLQGHAVPGGLSHGRFNCTDRIHAGPQPGEMADGSTRVVGVAGVRVDQVN
ncbi:MAG: hypothetical protein ACO3C0_09560, partial [Burkholderiaceae bacterium]